MSDIVIWFENAGLVWLSLLISALAGSLMTYGGDNLSKLLHKITVFFLSSMIVAQIVSAYQAQTSTILQGAAFGGLVITLLEEVLTFLSKIGVFIVATLLGTSGTLALLISTQIIDLRDLRGTTEGYYLAFGALIAGMIFAIIIIRIAHTPFVKSIGYSLAGTTFLIYLIANLKTFLQHGSIRWHFGDIWMYLMAHLSEEYDQLLRDDQFMMRIDGLVTEYNGLFFMLFISGVVTQAIVRFWHSLPGKETNT